MRYCNGDVSFRRTQKVAFFIEMGLSKHLKNWKFAIGILCLILNFTIGFVSKIPVIQLIREPSLIRETPFYFVSAILAYLFSWLIGALGVYLIGKETYLRFRRKVKTQVKDTYDLTVKKQYKNIKGKMMNKKEAKNEDK